MAFRFSSEQFSVHLTEDTALDRVLKLRYPDASWNDVRRLIDTGKVWLGDKRLSDSRLHLRGDVTLRIEMNTPRAKPGAVLDDALIVFCDAQLVVVRKPEGISSVAHEGELTSVEQQVRDWLSAKEKRRVPPMSIVHRLDKVTSGVMVFARNQVAKQFLKEQFRAHTVGRTYLALAHGQVRDGSLSFRLVRDRGDGLRGVTTEPLRGKHSVTHLEVVERFARCCLVRCRLETGRTHQIRIHLSHIQHPIVGEPLYTAGYGGEWIDSPRTLLHAATLNLEHPGHRGRLQFEEPLPASFQRVLDRERARAGATRG